MWTQVYAPIAGSLGVSAIAAAIPIVILFLMLGVLRRPAWESAVAALVSAFAVAVAVYKMPVKLAVISAAYG
ncbi:MAG TPA: L-lactate permease, partial [Vicinamibacterales bacterium]|nr:L-lactate permease [Vicinamibacterales bacterium]